MESLLFDRDFFRVREEGGRIGLRGGGLFVLFVFYLENMFTNTILKHKYANNVHEDCSYIKNRLRGGRFQKSESSVICVVIAEGSANALPVFMSIHAHFAFQSPCTTRMSFGV